MSLLGVNFDKGKLSHAPALIAAMPKQMRQSVLAQACARAVLGALSPQDIDKLDKLWKGKPHAPAITKQLMERVRQNPGREPRAPGEVAERLAARGWLDVSWLEDKDLDSPTGRALRAREDQARLNVSVASAPASRVRKRL